MEINYRSIQVKYKEKANTYTFTCNHLDTIRKKDMSLLFPKFVIRYIFGRNGNNFTIPSFGLLELDYILSSILDNSEISNSLGLANITINDLLNYIRTETWVAGRYQKIVSPIDYNLIKKEMKFNILPSQQPAFEKYEEVKVLAGLRGAMLDAAPGAGKTFMSLALSVGLEYDTTIIIAPRQTLDEVWVKSVTDSLFKTPQSYIVLDNKHKDVKGKRFIIFHYEFLEKVVEDKKLLKLLIKLKPNIIVDEFHNFNNINSKRTNNLLKLINEINAEDVILLTGTPIKMATSELIPLLYALDSKFPSAITFFNDMYKVYDVRLMNMLQYRFGLYRRRIEKDDDNIPGLTVTEYKVKLKKYNRYLIENIQADMTEYKNNRYNELMLAYDEYYKEFLKFIDYVKKENIKNKIMTKAEAELKFKQYLLNVNEVFKLAESNKIYLAYGTINIINEFETNYIEKYLELDKLKRFRDIKSIIKYPKLKAMGEALGRILLTRRIECYNELAKNLDYKEIIDDADKKTVIFSNYTSTCEIAFEKTLKLKYYSLRVYGDFTKDLTPTVQKFMDIKNKSNPLIATYKSLSTGVPLIAANTMVCLDLPFRMYIFDQSVSRIYRLGQDKRTFVFIVKLDTGEEPNITQKDLFILNTSQMRVEMITDNEFSYDVPKEDYFKKEDISEEISEPDNEIENIVSNIVESSLDNATNHLLRKIKNITNLIKIKVLGD